MYVLLYMPDLASCHQNSFHQIVLCLTMSKISSMGSDSQKFEPALATELC